MKKSLLQTLFIGYSLFSFAQVESVSTIPSEYIILIENVENELINELTIIEFKEKILKNNFIVIGETHGVRESTNIIKQIARTKKIDHFISEIDSISINHIYENIDSSSAILQKLPGAYSMYSYKEDMELLNLLRDSNTIIDGVDLLHPASIRLILYELSNSPNLDTKSLNKIRGLIESHSNNLTKGYLSAKTNKNTVKLLAKLMEKCPEYERSLIRYILNNKYPYNMMSARAVYMINRMKKIVENTDLLQQNVLFKFGASHTIKTDNTAGFHDVGWYIDSLSKQKLVDAYFMTIVPVSGKIGLPFEINGMTSKGFDFNSKYYESLHNLYNSVNQGNSSLFIDVESFRQSLDDRTVISKELKDILDKYDGIIFIEQVTPSQLLKTIANTR